MQKVSVWQKISVIAWSDNAIGIIVILLLIQNLIQHLTSTFRTFIYRIYSSLAPLNPSQLLIEFWQLSNSSHNEASNTNTGP